MTQMINKKPREEENQYCFACGSKNPIGLHLEFHEEGDTYTAMYIAPPEFQSYDGIMHGGIVSTLLDEIMGGYLYSKGHKAVTARLDVRYRKPTPIGTPLKIMGWIQSRRGNFIDMCSTVSLADGTVTAEGTAKIAILEEEL